MGVFFLHYSNPGIILKSMNIIDLNEGHESTWLNCLEDWSDEMKESGNGKKNWYSRYKDKGLRVKLALEKEQVIGMIQYIPIEHSHVKGESLYFIYCIWVHGHKQGIGNHQHRGTGKALLQAAESDVRNLGAKGIAAWGLAMPIWMKSSWYRKQGYRVADRDGIAHLVWKPFTTEAKKPQWIKMVKKPEYRKDRVVVTAFRNGWCQVQNINCERAKKAASQFGSRVHYREIDTTEKTALEEWGISDGIFLDNKLISTGPPLTIEKIEKQINRQLRRKHL